jgi:hypothetical protein
MTARRRSVSAVRRFALGAAAVAFTARVASAADTVQVQGRPAEVVREMASDAATVEMVQPGQSLEVLGKTGRWLQVRTPGGKTGYVPETMVKRRDAGGNGFSNFVGALAGNPNASEMGASAATRGLTPEAEKYAQSRGLRTDAPDRLVALRQSAKPDLKRFKETGNVGVRRE